MFQKFKYRGFMKTNYEKLTSSSQMTLGELRKLVTDQTLPDDTPVYVFYDRTRIHRVSELDILKVKSVVKDNLVAFDLDCIGICAEYIEPNEN